MIDLGGQILLPGLINCHHHLDQILTRNFPAGAEHEPVPLADGALSRLGAHRRRRTRAPPLIGCGELALSGCTTVFDHTYLFQNGNKVD